MASWYSKELGDGVEAFEPTTEIQDKFFELTMKRILSVDNSSDVAVFSRYDLKTNVVTVYFSPSAKPLAKVFDATPCNKPVPTEDLALIASVNQAWDLHFPGYRKNIY